MLFLQECLIGSEISVYSCIFRLLVSFIGGCILGLERKFRTQFVGMRTIILISVSSTLLMLLSIYMANFFSQGTGDPARIAAQVVSGIGFLGGGAILRHGFNVKGLTSAAIIWAAAALGLAFGAGFFLPAVITLVIAIVSLVVMEFLEERLFPAEQLKTLAMTCGKDIPSHKMLEESVKPFGVIVTNLQAASTNTDGTVILMYNIKIPKHIDFSGLTTHLLEDFNVQSVTIE